MSEYSIDFTKEGCTEPVAAPQGVDLRQWAAIIAEADLFFGCDSVGQHIAYAKEVPAVVVVGSTCKENISYPNYEKFEVLDMGEGLRIYDPIRIAMDEVTHRINDGIMAMNDKVEEVIIDSIDKMMKKFYVKKNEMIVLPNQDCGTEECGVPPQQNTQTPRMIGASEAFPTISSMLESSKKKTAIDELIQSSKNGNSKKPTGFVDTVKK